MDLNLVDQLVRETKFKELVQLFKRSTDGQYQEYQVVNYRNNKLAVGSKVMIREKIESLEKFAALIKAIICLTDRRGYNIPLLKVQWYGTKEDVIVPEKYKGCVSDKELFLSNLESYQLIDLVQRPIKVLSSQEYENLEWEEDWVFFSRAGYNHQTYEVSPPFTKWPTSCICKMPNNPDLCYVGCERCQRWFHQDCVKIREDQKFICQKCQ